MDELKPCPFCGGKAMIMEHHSSSHGTEKILIGCTTCDARLEAEKRYMMVERVDQYGQRIFVNSGIAVSLGAIEQWNRRASDEQEPENLR